MTAFKTGISTRIKLEIVNSKTGAVRQGPGPFPNMILNGGLDRMNAASQGNLYSHCRVGTGTIEPSGEQDGLTNPVSGFALGGSDSTANSGGFPWWQQRSRTYSFDPAGSAGIAGLPISEIEFRESGSESAVCYARALIRDSEGNPTTITLLTDEILRVVYSVRNNVPTGDVTGVVSIEGEDYNYTARAINGSAYNTWGPEINAGRPLVPVDVKLWEATPLADDGGILDGGSSSTGTTQRTSIYVDGSFARGIGVEAGPTQANYAGGIGTILFGRYISGAGGGFRAMIQCNVSRVSDGAGIPKTSDDILVFNDFITYTWGRA